jgi:DnaJ-class molecular chaperone
MENLPDLYAVLRVDASATQQQIARAYRALMRTHHPDVDGGDGGAGGGTDGGETAGSELQNTELLRIMQAFAVLREPARRAAYDRSLAARAGPADGPQNIPVRRIRTQDKPSGHTIRITPVRWESGPWA